jgi:hypothetical protein
MVDRTQALAKAITTPAIGPDAKPMLPALCIASLRRETVNARHNRLIRDGQ